MVQKSPNDKALSEPKAKQTLGVASNVTTSGIFKSGDFLPELRGSRAISKYREMRDNSAVIGAVLYAVEQVLRDVDLKVKPADDSEVAIKEAKFVESVLDDMEHSLDDHISEAIGFLSMGFSWFEVVYKRRDGLGTRDPKKRSKHSDQRLGIRKIVSRAPWSISKFDVEPKTGKILGVHQRESHSNNKLDTLIPINKSLYYKTPTIDGDPSGRSILRNAYTSYTYLTNLQSIEGIAVEREMHGIPIGRIPAEYLAEDATDSQVAVRNQMEKVLSDLKLNQQGYALLPSDLLLDQDGKSTGGVAARLIDIELITSNGNRNIDISPIIDRYQHDIARSVLSEFLMLGTGSGGSYALSKSKTDLFLRALESYISTVADILNKQLVERLWDLNGLPIETMPKLVAGDVAPHDLKELGSYLRNLNGADISLADQHDIVDALLHNAELPKLDRTQYKESRGEVKEAAKPAVAPEPRGPTAQEEADLELSKVALEVLKNETS
tara:strand:+ start:346 stop:1830 length:1485 start_codon:yes stop_codon:yes gene_type:complete